MLSESIGHGWDLAIVDCDFQIAHAGLGGIHDEVHLHLFSQTQ